MQCQSFTCDNGQVICLHCQRLLTPGEMRDCSAPSRQPPLATLHDSRLTLACLHRGAELRRELCASCRGHVEIKVFGCALHGECSFVNAGLQNVAACAGCGERQPPAVSPES